MAHLIGAIVVVFVGAATMLLGLIQMPRDGSPIFGSAGFAIWCTGIVVTISSLWVKGKVMAERKVVQIATMPETERVATHVIALCNDGTIWVQSWTISGGIPEWEQIKTVPQPFP